MYSRGGRGFLLTVQSLKQWYTKGDPKITRIFFMEGRGAVLPSAPARCVYVTALRISWPSGVLEERSIGSVWFFSWASVVVFVDFSMADLKERRVCIECCLLLGKTAAQTVTMLREAFKEEAPSQARVYEWFSRFKRGDMSLEDQPRSGRPSTSRTDENIKKNSRCVFVPLSYSIRQAIAQTSWRTDGMNEWLTDYIEQNPSR